MGHSQSKPSGRPTGQDSSSPRDSSSTSRTNHSNNQSNLDDASALSSSSSQDQVKRRRKRKDSLSGSEASAHSKHDNGHSKIDSTEAAASTQHSALRFRRKRRLSLGTSLGLSREGSFKAKAKNNDAPSDEMDLDAQARPLTDPNIGQTVTDGKGKGKRRDVSDNQSSTLAASLPSQSSSSSLNVGPSFSEPLATDSNLTESTQPHDPFRHVWQSARPDTSNSTNSAEPVDSPTSGTPSHFDALRNEREWARHQIEQALGPIESRASGPVSDSVLQAPQSSSSSNTLASLLGDALGIGRSASAPLQGLTQPSNSASLVPSSAVSLPQTNQIAELQQDQPQLQEQQSRGQQSQEQLPPHQQAQMPLRRPMLHPAAMTGTSVIVQGALVARTVPSPRPATSTRSSGSPASQLATASDSLTNEPNSNSTDPSHMPHDPRTGDSEPRPATLEEQAAMLSRILGIATAATAASLVNPIATLASDRALLFSTLQPTLEALEARDQSSRNEQSPRDLPTPPSVATSDSGSSLGQGLRDRLAALSNRVRNVSSQANTRSNDDDGRARESHQALTRLLNVARRRDATLSSRDGEETDTGGQTAGTDTTENHRHGDGIASENEAGPTGDASTRISASALSRLMRETVNQLVSSSRLARPHQSGGLQSSHETARANSETQDAASINQRGSTAAPSHPDGYSVGPNDVAGPLRQVREGLALPESEPGSFGNFLHHLLRDLTVAVQSINPEIEGQPQVTTGDYFERANEDEPTNGAEALDGDSDEANQDIPSASQSNDRDSVDGTTLNDSLNNGEARLRRQRDIENGQLSFFRLFRFDPVAPSTLVPCVVVGVRSVSANEMPIGEPDNEPAASPSSGQTASGTPLFPTFSSSSSSSESESDSPTASRERETPATTEGEPSSNAGSQTNPHGAGEASQSGQEMPVSRFLLFVSGGRYPENHPLLTANPTAAGRDLMTLMELLGTVQAMQSKPSTVTQQEVDSSDLEKIKGSQVDDMVKLGKIKENTAERCLVCLEDWAPEDECRLLACQHVFHAACVDKWMTNSSNTCPMCRRQGVSKDGRTTGEETPDSRSMNPPPTQGMATSATMTNEAGAPN